MEGKIRQPRWRNRLSLVVTVAFFVIMSVVVVSGCATPEKSAEEPAASATEEQVAVEVEEVEYLFVQHAEAVTLADGVLTLEGIGDDVLYFSDRPHRIVGRVSLEEFLGSWTEGEESFAEVPPNAVLTVKQEDELRDLTVVLKNPVLTERTLAYQVEVLDGPEAGSGAFAALFIDVIGDPISGPRGEVRRTARRTSRRTARRTARRVDRRQDYYDEQQDYDDDDGPYNENSELEERLRELDDLLDQGLITQEDYDREKEELLRQY